jgi:GNAT superfamily N-acetyltransferase
MRILVARCSELPAGEWGRLEEIAEGEFSQYALVRETRWAQPDWCVRGFEAEQLAVFYNLILRTVNIDGAPVRVTGLNNMITLPAFRGRGVASRMLRDTQPWWLEEFEADCGMLLCADALVPFYAKLGWVRSEAQVRYAQPSGSKIWAANCMILSEDARYASAREIDLCGLPW